METAINAAAAAQQVIGVLSDTHNLLRPEVVGHLRGCSAILHAGDVCNPGLLDQLASIAPVQAVRGNGDREDMEHLPSLLETTVCGLRVCMAHKKKDLPADLRPYDLAICGHSHQYASVWTGFPDTNRRTLLLNPGSCGPRRFHQPITLALVTLSADGWDVRRVEIPHAAGEASPKPGADLRQQIEIVVRETQKGQTVKAIAQRHTLPPGLVEQIARLYLTHPGVTPEGIMAKMGL